MKKTPALLRSCYCLGIFCAMTLLLTASAPAVPVAPCDPEGNPISLEELIERAPEWVLEFIKAELRKGSLDNVGYLSRMFLRQRPGNTDARAMYCAWLVASGDLKEANEQMSRIPSSSAENPLVLYARAMTKQAEKHYNAAISLCRKAIRLDKTHPFPWTIMGRVYFDLEQNEKALDCFKKAVELEPDFLLGYTNLGIASFVLEDYEQSVSFYKHALKLNNKSFIAHYGLAMTYRVEGKNGQAMTEFRKSLEIEPDNRASLDQLAELQLDAGKYSEALATGREMEKYGLDEAYETLGEATLGMGKPLDALRELNKAPDVGPAVSYLKGYCFMALGQYEKALSQMEAVLSESSRSFGAYASRAVLKFCLHQEVDPAQDLQNRWGPAAARLMSYISGSICASKGDWAGAEKGFQSAETLVSGFSMAGVDRATLANGLKKEEIGPIALGILFYFKDLFNYALLEFEKAVKMNKDSILGNYWAAQVCLKKGERDRALRFFQNATNKAPRFFAALSAIGELHFTKGDPHKAAVYYERALAVKKDPGLFIRLGLYYEKTGKFEAAEEQYRQAIQAAPDLFIGYNQLAWLYARQGVRLDRAQALARKANDLQPGNAGVLDTLGWICYRKKDYDPAIAHLEKAVLINPNNPTILYHLARACHAREKDRPAKKLLEKALQLSADFEGAENARALLSQLD